MPNDKSYKSRIKPYQLTSGLIVDESVDKYLDNCKIFKELPNPCGLSLYLGFNDIQSMHQYFNDHKRLKQSLSRAYNIMQERGIQWLAQPDIKNSNGIRAYMSKNFGYNDKIDINQSVTSKVIRLPAKKTPGAPVDHKGKTKTIQSAKKKVDNNKK